MAWHRSGAAYSPLRDVELSLEQSSLSGVYAARLLRSLGAAVERVDLTPAAVALDAARDWAESGLVPLTGLRDELPLVGPAAIPSCARGALLALSALAPDGALESLDGARLLSERAALLGLGRRGRASPNGACHLLAAAGGDVALNMARADDWELLPALLETHTPLRHIDQLAVAVRGVAVEQLVERGRLLGLAIAPARSVCSGLHPWYRLDRTLSGARSVASGGARPLLIDLSSLWAGPLCTQLLQLAGARVVKVESTARPDGARLGSADFYHLLNAGKASVALDLTGARGRRQLRELLLRADIVIEGSRPRALRQMGIRAGELLQAKPGLTWVSITGYGRLQPQAQWVAFGDDAAVAAGVAAATADPPVFCGDALADPLTGLHAAVAALAGWRSGGGVLFDVSLCNVTAHCLGFETQLTRAGVTGTEHRQHLLIGGHRFPVQGPRVRSTRHRAATMGADTQHILAQWNITC